MKSKTSTIRISIKSKAKSPSFVTFTLLAQLFTSYFLVKPQPLKSWNISMINGFMRTALARMCTRCLRSSRTTFYQMTWFILLLSFSNKILKTDSKTWLKSGASLLSWEKTFFRLHSSLGSCLVILSSQMSTFSMLKALNISQNLTAVSGSKTIS